MLADRIGVMSARPGRLIDIVETSWPRERDSRIVENAGVRRDHRAPVEGAAAGIDEGDRPGIRFAMKQIWLHQASRVLAVALVAMLEMLCRVGVIDKITMQAPT